VGDLDRGVQAGHLAVDASQQVSSGRVRENLVGLHRSTAPHVGRTDAAELRERIATVLLAA
jgi:hypothetical protein